MTYSYKKPTCQANTACVATMSSVKMYSSKGKKNSTNLNFSYLLQTLSEKSPKVLRSLLLMVIIFVTGISMNGDWLHIYTHILRYLRQTGNINHYVFDHLSDKFKDLPRCLLSSVIINCGFYLILCSYLQWYFYIRQRDSPEKWKCQPRKFLPSEDERHEIILGTACCLQASLISGAVSCYINNGGHSTLYYNVSDYGLVYLLFSVPLVFCYMEALLYYAHRMLHFPIFYKSIHKYHHRYKQPTPFSALAMHPMELLLDQIIVMLPSFVVPIHFVAFFSLLGYNYYYGILNHSGIKMQSIWPWQCHTLFHDDHHKYFHVNFGINTPFMDKLHGTYRRKDRIYNEKTFYGRGKNLTDATQEELEEHSKD